MSNDTQGRDSAPGADDRTTELLRLALGDEAAAVDPDPAGLHAIRSRTASDSAASRRVRRRWLLVTPIGAGLAAAAVIFGVVVANGGSKTASTPPVTQPTGKGGGGTVAQAYTPPDKHDGAYDPSAPADEQFTVYYPGNVPDPTSGDPMQTVRLYSETHTVADPGDDPRLAALNELLRGTPIDPDYNAWLPQDLYATGIDESGGVTTVHLAGDLSELNIGIQPHPSPAGFSQNEGVALQGLLRTIAADGSVRFTYNDKPIDMLELNDVSPLATAADDDVRAFVSIDNIVDGQTVSGDVSVLISGNTFEGTVNWTLRESDGTKVDDGFVTTSMGMWTQVPVDLGVLDTGTYTITALEYSAEDGHPTDVDDKTFTVQ